MKRSCGILLPISALPSPYGIGTLGKSAYHFVDFLAAAGQSWWQILPVGPTSYGDSPYQSPSAFAGNPYFIDLEYLEKEGLLKKEDYVDVDWEFNGRINYGALYNKRYPILRLACKRFIEKGDFKDFEKFEKENEWLEDYALFQTIKEKLNYDDIRINIRIILSTKKVHN